MKSEPEFWGYGRVRTLSRQRQRIQVGKTNFFSVAQVYELLRSQSFHKMRTTPPASKPRAERSLHFWVIEMTKFMSFVIGWVYLVMVLDGYITKIVGWDISLKSRGKEWKHASAMEVKEQFPETIKEKARILKADYGPQPTVTSLWEDIVTSMINQNILAIILLRAMLMQGE